MIRGHAAANRTESGDDMGLIYFEGGPYDATAYETEALLGAQALNLPAITQYHWTSEKKTSQTSGATAQIWRHDSLVNQTRDAVPAPAPTMAAVPPQPTAAVNGSAYPEDSTRVDVQQTAPTAATGELSAVPDADEAEEPVANGEVPLGLDGATLLARRKALKMSRAEISDLSGMTQSKLGGIETEKAKRIKLSERQQYADALSRAEGSVSVGSGATG